MRTETHQPTMDPPTAAPAETRRKAPVFLTVAETARLCRTSPMTIYRAIASGEFPAVRIRGRLIVPARAIEEMVQAATAGGTVDAAAWVPQGVAEQLDPLGERRHQTHRGSALR